MISDLGAEAGAVAATGKAYALAYPFGIIGILLSMLVVRLLFGIDVAAEGTAFESTRRAITAPSRESTSKFAIRRSSVAGFAIWMS